MGFYFTPWVSDMLDASGGFGSWNLSINQGLAHMQATSYLNSCWGFGCGFMPYSSFGGGMDILLNPNYAVWQAMTGNNSCSNIFGNGFGNFGDLWSIGNGGGGGNGNGGKKDLTPAEEAAQTDFKSLKDKINNFADELIKNDNTNAAGKSLKKFIDDLGKNKDLTWPQKYSKLKDKYNEIMGNSDYRAYYKDYLENNGTIKFQLNTSVSGKNDPPPLKSLIAMTGIGSFSAGTDGEGKTIDDAYIHEQMLGMSNSQPNTTQYLQSITEKNILQFLSDYNSNHKSKNFVAFFLEKYDNLGATEKEEALKGLISVKDKLVKRANGIKDRMKDPSKMADAVKALNGHFEGTFDSSGLEDDFNYLYALVRMTEVEALNKEIDSRLKGDVLSDENKPSKVLDLKEKTSNDLQEELSITLPVDSDIACKEITTLKPLESNVAEESDEDEEESVPKKQSDNEKTFEGKNEHCYYKTQVCIDGRTVYKWTNPKPCPDNDDIKKGALFVVDGENSVRLLGDEESLDYGVKATQKSGKTGKSVGDNKTVFKWQGEEIDGIKPNDLCVIEDGKPRLLENDEIGEYGLHKKTRAKDPTTQTPIEKDGTPVYEWTIDEVYTTQSRIPLVKGDQFIIINGKPQALQ